MTKPRPEPLFLDEADIARAVLGKDAGRWRDLVKLLERDGMPLIDTVMGGRYWPAVKAWFDRKYGVSDRAVPNAADGEERLPCPKPRQDSSSAPEVSGNIRHFTGSHRGRPSKPGSPPSPSGSPKV